LALEKKKGKNKTNHLVKAEVRAATDKPKAKGTDTGSQGKKRGEDGIRSFGNAHTFKKGKKDPTMSQQKKRKEKKR